MDRSPPAAAGCVFAILVATPNRGIAASVPPSFCMKPRRQVQGVNNPIISSLCCGHLLKRLTPGCRVPRPAHRGYHVPAANVKNTPGFDTNILKYASGVLGSNTDEVSALAAWSMTLPESGRLFPFLRVMR